MPDGKTTEAGLIPAFFKIGDIYIAYPADDPWAAARKVIGTFPSDFMNDREQPSWHDIN